MGLGGWRAHGRGGRGRGRPARDRNELPGPPGVRHPKDRRVLEEKIRVPARSADARAHRELAPRPKGERASPDRSAGLEIVRPDEIARTAVAAHGRHGGTYGCIEAVRGVKSVVFPGTSHNATSM